MCKNFREVIISPLKEREFSHLILYKSSFTPIEMKHLDGLKEVESKQISEDSIRLYFHSKGVNFAVTVFSKEQLDAIVRQYGLK